MIGQMMEPVEFRPPAKAGVVDKSWAATGCKGRDPVIIRSLFLDPLVLERNNLELAAKYARMEREEVRFERYNVRPDNRLLLVSYGTMARVCKTVIDELGAKGISLGLLRPISLFPFPKAAIAEAAKGVKAVLSVEMSLGQMVDDVRLALNGAKPVHFFGRTGGVVPTPDEVAENVQKYL
jgi:2-oxoglutarate ferredoxin oxidoreductase subunit alpha